MFLPEAVQKAELHRFFLNTFQGWHGRESADGAVVSVFVTFKMTYLENAGSPRFSSDAWLSSAPDKPLSADFCFYFPFCRQTVNAGT